MNKKLYDGICEWTIQHKALANVCKQRCISLDFTFCLHCAFLKLFKVRDSIIL